VELTTSFLRTIEKPGRYLTPSIGADTGDPERDSPRILVVFPDLFEIARSHEGIRIVYHLFRRAGAFVDISFAFRSDMERHYRAKGRLESFFTALDWRSFDLIAVSFQYPLQFPTFLRMLTVANIPLRSADRKSSDPIVMAGGPVMANPEPMREFLDCVYIGEVEPQARRIVEVLRTYSSREERIAVYHAEVVPVRAIHSGLDDLSLVPYHHPLFGLPTVHDRYTVEIQRGCTRGCRFCFAGIVYRPHRERSVARVIELLERDMAKGGYREAGFLSLSAGDHRRIEDILLVATRCAGEWCSFSLPSLRPETLTEPMVRALAPLRKGGFTLAPESGSERLRRLINKQNSTKDLLASVDRVFDAGWLHLKLYFMVGLPTETEADIEESIALLHEISFRAKRRGGRARVTASFSTFVPQPFTPFQWEGMASLDEIERKQRMLIAGLKKCRNLKLSWHNRFVSRIEGVLSRAGRRVAPAIEWVADKMQNIQTWDEGFDFGLWMEAFARAGVDPAVECGSRPLDLLFPYEYVSVGVSREFLLREREKAFRGEETPDCVDGACAGCGVCDFDTVRPMCDESSTPLFVTSPAETVHHFNRGNADPWLFSFVKEGRALSLGHLDLVEFFIKGFTREGIRILYSEGFNPSPRFSLLDPLPVGVASEREYGIVWLTKPYNADDIVRRLNDLYRGTGITFLSFVLLAREEVKGVRRALTTLPHRYRCRFGTPEECNSFLVKRPALAVERENDMTIIITRMPGEGSVIRLFDGFAGTFHLTKLKDS